MARLPGWLPSLLKRIDWGCANSPLLTSLDDDSQALETGRAICLDLWPFINNLPANISLVRDSLPEDMHAARNLLGQLADDERYYQQLFLSQCRLAGLSDDDLANHIPSPATRELCSTLERYTRSGSYERGIYAILAAELAATAFARAAFPKYVDYFDRFADSYEAQTVKEGLNWLRLHAEPHTRHALWLKRMLADIPNAGRKEMPEPVEAFLNAVFRLWRCPQEAPALLRT